MRTRTRSGPSGGGRAWRRATISESKFDQILKPPHYERLRARLVRIFARRGCSAPEDLADETILRVVAKLPELGKEYEGDPVHYFIGVARNIFLEYLRQPRTVPVDTGMEVMAPDRSDDAAERRDRCLQHCLMELDVKDRQLIEDYYLHRGATKIACRRELAEKLGVGLNALRIRAYRIRQRLNRCVMSCLSPLEK